MSYLASNPMIILNKNPMKRPLPSHQYHMGPTIIRLALAGAITITGMYGFLVAFATAIRTF